MKVGVYHNVKYISVNKEYIDKIFSRLQSSKIECTVVDCPKKIENLDILIVLGGDGTILTVASYCALYSVKIIGINYGHMGFLADFEPNQLDSALDMICSGEYSTEGRAMLQVEYCGKTYYALNDAVVQRNTAGSSYSNTVNLHAEIDGSTVDNFSSDGIIVSTPTGSTAYSLAAGGSVLSPDLQAFILTPICAHSLHSRPIVFSDKAVLKVKRIDEKSSLNLIIDGKLVRSVDGFDFITVKKADRCVEFITADGVNFYDKLLYKLNVWSK